jgi:hypothetical protein
MPNPDHWSHQLHREPDGTYHLEILDERGELYPIARGITQGQATMLLRAIEQEATRRRYAIAEIIRDPAFMAPTIIAVKRANGKQL